MMTTCEERLKALLQAVLDSIAGHDFVANASPRSGLHEHCAGQVAGRQRLASLLRDQMGGEAVPGASRDVCRGSMHRLFVSLDAALAQDDESAIKALQRGDALLAQRIENAIIGGGLDGPAENIVRELCRTVNESQSRLIAELSSRAGRPAAP